MSVLLCPWTVQAQAPSLQRVTLSPVTVNLTSGSPKITAEIEFQAPGRLSQAYVNFTNAAGDTIYGYVDLGYPAPLPSLTSGTFTREIYLSAGRAPGPWQVWVELTDESGTRSRFGGAGNPALPAGSTTEVTFQNTGVADTQLPSLISGSITPNSVNVSTAAQTVTLTATASDDRSLYYVRVILTPPGGTGSELSFSLEQSNLVSGTLQSGTFSRQVSIPASLPAGAWSVSYRVFDQSSRGRVYGGATGLALPAEAQSTLTVVNSAAADTTGPAVTAISFSRSTVDITSGVQQVIVNFTLHDTPGGLRLARLRLYSPQGEMVEDFPIYNEPPPYPTAPFARTSAMNIRRYLPPGIYRWQITGLDGLGYTSTHGYNGLAFPGGVSDQLTVQNTGPVETSRPVVVSHTLSPNGFSAAQLPVSLTVTARVTDDVAVSKVDFFLQDPRYPTQKETYFMSRTSGTSQDGIWSVTFTLGTDYAPGTYNIGFATYDSSSIFPAEYGAFGGFGSHPLPAGGPAQLTILSHHSEGHAYSVWRAQYPAMAGASGEPGADHDGDGFANVVEFLCGTDPLLDSNSIATDPAALRAPRFVPKAGRLRLEYGLSAANIALGTGNVYQLIPQWTNYPGQTWRNDVPYQGTTSGTDIRWAELPMEVPAIFLRLKVTP